LARRRYIRPPSPYAGAAAAVAAGSLPVLEPNMKNEIHPNYVTALVTCACGSVVTTRSTRGTFTTDICSACHPFYTGKQKLIDVAGRVDRFRKKYGGDKAGPPPAPPAAA